jgi:hypothetical protein
VRKAKKKKIANSGRGEVGDEVGDTVGDKRHSKY